MAADPPLVIEVLRVSHMEGVESPSKSTVGLRHADKMDMIGHKAIGPNMYAVSGGINRKPIEVASIIGFIPEYGLIIAPPLNEMVGIAHEDRSGETGHSGKLPPSGVSRAHDGANESVHQPRRLFKGTGGQLESRKRTSPIRPHRAQKREQIVLNPDIVSQGINGDSGCLREGQNQGRTIMSIRSFH